MAQALPVGNDQFGDIREKNTYYVDKTLMICDFLTLDDKVTLITRPRRFGKTLNMTMLKAFFDITLDSKDIFAGLDIKGSVEVGVDLETSFVELQNSYSLWGLLVNSGYLTAESIYEGKESLMRVRIPNAEVSAEFQKLVVTCTSAFDAKENAYHMLFLGMCITLQGMYKVKSNIEMGHGRRNCS